MSILSTILAFVVAIVLLIAIHEWGHFIVARLFGVKVLRFSIGFGKPLLRYMGRKGTEYVLAIIPLGGYVKMLDETEGPVADEDKPYAFNRKSVWARFLVVAAGPTINLILAVIVFWVMYLVGLEQTRPLVGKVYPNTVASVSGLVPQDEIVSVDGVATPSWQAVMINLVMHLGNEGDLPVVVKQQDGTLKTLTMDLNKWQIDELNPQPIRSLGLAPYFPKIPAVIAMVEEGGPAQQAGIKVGDEVLAVNSEPTEDWVEFVQQVQKYPNKTILLDIKRDGEQITLQAHVGSKRARVLQTYGYLGVMPKSVDFPEDMIITRQFGVLSGIKPAVEEVTMFLKFNAVMLGKLFTGTLSLRSLGGPITIFRTSDQAWQQGITIYLSFIGLISVMLAFVNFLPIPGLDGGHLLFYLIEIVRRRPLSPAAQVLTLRIGLIFLLVIMAHATINDVLRLV